MRYLLVQSIKLASKIAGLLFVITVAAVICYSIVIARAVLDIKHDDPFYGHYRFPAHLPDGNMLCDEKGNAILFDSRKSAAAYAAQYKDDPPEIIKAVEQACLDYSLSNKAVRVKQSKRP